MANPPTGKLTPPGVSVEEAQPPTAPTILLIELDRILPSPKNPRRLREDGGDSHVREIAESIKSVGVLHPILVRPVNDHYEIMAGERRWRASRLAGLPTIPAIVRPLGDKAALEITVIENMQREGLHPLEEARGLKELLEAGYTVEDAAARLGKSRAWIACRAQLTELIPELATAASGENEELDLSRWSVRSLELVARLPEPTQGLLWEEFLEYAQSPYDKEQIEEATTDEVQSMVNRFMLDLKSAPWDMRETLGNCPACAQCPKRSQTQPDLFGAGEDEEDRCLDPQCWDRKSTLHTERFIAETERRHPGVLKVSAHYQTEMPGILDRQHYRVVREGTEGAAPAVIVEGRMPELVWIKIDSGKHSRRAAACAGGEVQDETARIVARKAQYDKLRRGIVMDLLAARLKDLVEDGVGPTCAVTPRKVMACLLAIGLPYSYLSTMDYRNPWPVVDQNLEKSEGELLMDLALQMAEAFNKRLHAYHDEPKWAEALAIAELYGIDLDGLSREAALRKPYPKTWRARAETLPPSPIPDRAFYATAEKVSALAVVVHDADDEHVEHDGPDEDQDDESDFEGE